MFAFYKMDDYVTASLPQTIAIAEPLVAVLVDALYDRTGTVNAAVRTVVARQQGEVVWYYFDIVELSF